MKLIFDIGYNEGHFTKACNKKMPDCKSELWHDVV
jgi:hypothetical protein